MRGFSNGIPFQRSTITFDDEPMPRQKRPWLASCIAEACWASTAGPRVNTFTTPVPSRIRSVQAAASSSDVKPSWPPVSPDHASVYPASSAARTTGSCSGRLRPGSSSDKAWRRFIAARGYSFPRRGRLLELLRERPLPVQIVLALVVPAAFGALAGWLLGVNEVAYLIVSVLAIGGGYFAGREHMGAGEGALRGLVGGALFGGFILLVHEAIGKEPKADLPHPEILLLAITVVFGVVLGALGGRATKRKAEAEDEEEEEAPGFDLKRVQALGDHRLRRRRGARLRGPLPELVLDELPEPVGRPCGGCGRGRLQPELQDRRRHHQQGAVRRVHRVGDLRVHAYLLLAACIAPFILAYIIARGHGLSWRPGEITMIVGMVAFALILLNGIILGSPGGSDRIAVDISRELGYLHRIVWRAPHMCGRLPPTSRGHPGEAAWDLISATHA